MSQLVCSFLATSAAILLVRLVGGSVDYIMFGCIMLQIPGISFTHAMENLILGDTLTGLMALSEAILIALALAGGFGLSITMLGGLLT